MKYLVLTDNGKVVTEAPRLGGTEIDATPVRGCVVTFYLVNNENCRILDRRSKIGSTSEYLRLVLGMFEGLSSDVEPEKKIEK